MKTITLQEVEYIAFKLARKKFSFNEPIPDFSTRFPNALESCLAVPFQRFSGKSLYPTLISKVAMLFYLLIKKLHNIYLIIVGGGKDAKVIAQKAARIGIRNRAIFVGYRPHEEIPDWLSMADVLVLPSYSEGLPAVIVEAMACKRAVIATKVGGISEAIVDGQSGILVEPRDSVALMKAMEKVARDKDLQLNMGNVGRQIVTEKFSWEENINKLTDIYKRVMTRTAG